MSLPTWLIVGVALVIVNGVFWAVMTALLTRRTLPRTRRGVEEIDL